MAIPKTASKQRNPMVIAFTGINRKQGKLTATIRALEATRHRDMATVVGGRSTSLARDVANSELVKDATKESIAEFKPLVIRYNL
jgi:hypothetical protein